VQIDVPRGWWVLDEEINRLIATSVEAMMDISGLDFDAENSTVLFAANSMPLWSYASMRVELGSEPVTATEMAEMWSLSDADLGTVRNEMEAMSMQLLPRQNLAFIETLGIDKEKYGSYPAISFQLLRTGPKGPVVVDIIQVWRSDGIVTVNLAYRESEAALWKAVIARIKRSITIN